MSRIAALSLAGLLTATASAQTEPVRVVTTKRTITRADVPAQVVYDNSILLEPATFPGGEEALARHFHDALAAEALPATAPADSAAVISFIVEEDGSVNEVQVTRGLHPEVDKLILQAAVTMPPWQPAQVKGAAVRARLVREIATSAR